jgi:hypothetical protein
MKTPRNLLTSNDLAIPKLLDGESAVIIQRNAHITKSDKELSEKAAAEAKSVAHDTLLTYLQSLTSDEQKGVDVVVVGSDPWIGIHGADHPESQRSLLTAKEALAGIKTAMKSLDLDEKQLINTTAVRGRGVVEVSEIKPFQKLNDWPELYEFYKDKAAETGKDLEALFDYEAYKDEREHLGVEGHHELATRIEHFMSFSRGSANYHEHHKKRRLIFWAVTHFDTITPYLARILAHPAEHSMLVPVDYLGGIVLHISTDQTATVIVGGQKLSTNLHYAPVRG